MNAGHLLSILQRLRLDNNQFNIDARLRNLEASLQQVINSPSDTGYQEQFSDAFDVLKGEISEMASRYSPALISDISKIGGGLFFTEKMIERLSLNITDNAIDQNAIILSIKELIENRKKFIQYVEDTISSFEWFHIEVDSISEGEAEIGFRLPRNAFDNELEGLIKELKAIRLIIRAFSEQARGAPEDIEVRSISTSDPIFFFNLSIATVIGIGGAITWCLNSWKQIEEIKKLRNEVANLGHHSDDETKKFFDDKISNVVEESIIKKVNELTESLTSDLARKKEMGNALEMAIRSLLSRIEQGMTVEIRYLPPPVNDDSAEVENLQEDKLGAVRDSLDIISNQLFFPNVTSLPLGRLEAHNEQ